MPNLCVELRGYYAPPAAEEAAASASGSAPASASSSSTSGPPHPGTTGNNGDGNGAAATAASVTTAGHSGIWRGWGEEGEEQGKPRFLETQRTGETDGSFLFVTPESGVVLVLAAYPPHSGEENPVVRVVFPDDGSHSRGGGKEYASSFSDRGAGRRAGGGGGGGGEASAFGADSGRVLIHIDLSEEEGWAHAPEVLLWSASSSAAARRGKDRSPCARHEEAAVEEARGRGRLEAARGDDAAAAAGEAGPSARQRGRWALGDNDDHGGGSGGDGDKVDQAVAALTALLRSSRRYLGELGSGCWGASAAVYALLRSGLEAAAAAAGQRVLQSALAASKAASEWFGTGSTQFSNRLALFSPTPVLSLISRLLLRQRWPAWTDFSKWWSGDASHPHTRPRPAFARVVSWLEHELEQRGPVDVNLRAWWSVWWVRVGGIALALGLLQEVFAFIYKYFRPAAAAAAVEDVVDDRRCSGSPRHSQSQTRGQDSVGTISTLGGPLVGTLYSSDGKVRRVDLGKKLGQPEEPATAERKERKRRGGVFGAAWGRSSSSNDNSGRSKLADDIGGGSREQEGDEADEFSSMFRALSQTSCTVTDEDEIVGGGGGGASSNVVVVTQQSW